MAKAAARKARYAPYGEAGGELFKIATQMLDGRLVHLLIIFVRDKQLKGCRFWCGH